MPFGPPSTSLTIFPSMPAAVAATYSAGIQAIGTNQSDVAVILYSPNLQLLASLDNSNADSDSSYSLSVTTGFTFSATESISISEEVGVSVEVVTEKTTISFSLSFTEEWSQSTTTTLQVDCPAGKKAFVYQGTLMSRQLQLDASTGQYNWVSAASKALTQIILSSRVPIGQAPSNTVTINSGT